MGSRSNSSGYTIMRKTADLTVVATIQERTAARVSASRTAVAFLVPNHSSTREHQKLPVLCWEEILNVLWQSRSQNLEDESRSTVSVGPSSTQEGSQEVSTTLHTSCCWPTSRRCSFYFPTGLGNCTQSQSYQYLVQGTWYLCSKSLFWPSPRGYCEAKDVRCQIARREEGHYKSELGCQNTWPVGSMRGCTAAVFRQRERHASFFLMLILFSF